MGYVPACDQPVGSTATLLREPTGEVVRRTVLPGGLRVISESVPGARSAVFGIWIGSGSRHETASQHGAAHVLEHLLFKATRKRTALEVSAEIEAVGGEINAFTSREYTCFYARVLDRDLPLAADVIIDVVGGGLMRAADVASERDVVLEEIAMHEDDPADVAHEEFFFRALTSRALARPVLGTVDSITALEPAAIRSFHASHYRPENMVVAVAGHVDHDAVVQLVRGFGEPFGWFYGSATPALLTPARPARRRHVADHSLARPTEQTHVLVGGKGPTRSDPARYDMAVLNSSLGGGMSSRLFFTVREERGLAYSVYSFASPFVDDGCFGVYVGTKPSKAAEAIEVITDELAKAARSGLTADEVVRGKGQLRGTMLLGLEDPFARMSRLGKSEILLGELPGIDELHERIDAVTAESVAAIADRILGAPLFITTVGPAAP